MGTLRRRHRRQRAEAQDQADTSVWLSQVNASLEEPTEPAVKPASPVKPAQPVLKPQPVLEPQPVLPAQLLPAQPAQPAGRP